MWRYFLLILFLSFIGGWMILRFNPNPVFVEGMVGQPVDLIPGQGPRNGIDEVLEKLLFRSLFAYDQEDRIVTDLVESYSISKDGRVYEITLGKAFWLDGRPVTAADVAFTFTQNPAFSDITVEQEGERRIRFILKTPLSSFLGILTAPVAPAHFRELSLNLLGNSAFSIVEVKRESGRIALIKLENRGSGYLKELVFKFFPGEKGLLEAAERGEVDGLISDKFSSSSFALHKVPIFSRYFVLFFNLGSSNSLTKSGSFRKAAARKTPLVLGTEVRGPLSGTWAQADLPFPTFSKKPLKKFKGKLTITVPDEPVFTGTVQKIAAAWRSGLGVDVWVRKILPEQVSGVLEQRDFEALILEQEVERDPDRYNLWHSSQRDFPGQNVSGYADPRADRALEEARKLSKRSKRKVHYANLQRLFIEDNPAVLLYHPNLYYWVSRKFTGVDLSPVFSPEERFWNLLDWSSAFEPGE